MLAQLRLNPAPRQHLRQHRELAAGALMTENGEVTVVAGSLLVLEEDEWASRTAAHAAKVDTWTAGRLERASRGRSHPVDDFLFEYYPTRPGHLRRWHPGFGVALAGETPLTSDPAYTTVEVGGRTAITVDVARLARRRDGLAWIEGLLRQTHARPGRFGCFGMHEWAMVYGLDQDEVRHESWPLRLDAQAIRETVDQTGVRCTHFDAFRFFTPEAVPLNEMVPTRETQPGLDQPGCLHASMDLYKWSAKYAPYVGSDLVADCFALARDTRRLDMEAAPYDLSSLGYAPVRVETPDGRSDYVRRQHALTDRAQPLRQRLAHSLATTLTALDEHSGRELLPRSSV